MDVLVFTAARSNLPPVAMLVQLAEKDRQALLELSFGDRHEGDAPFRIGSVSGNIGSGDDRPNAFALVVAFVLRVDQEAQDQLLPPILPHRLDPPALLDPPVGVAVSRDQFPS